MLNAGRLRHRGSFDGVTTTTGPGGDPVEVVTTIAANVPCLVEPLTGSEKLRAMAVSERLSHRITTRYRAGITAATRFRYDGRGFNIVSVVDPEERHEKLVILAEEDRSAAQEMAA